MLEICWQGLTPAELPERVLGGSLGSLVVAMKLQDRWLQDSSKKMSFPFLYHSSRVLSLYHELLDDDIYIYIIYIYRYVIAIV